MRRSAYLLAVLGVSVQSAVGQETPGSSPALRPAAQNSLFSAPDGNLPGEAPPQRFLRAAPPAPANTELNKIYSELMQQPAGNKPAPPLAPPADSRFRLSNAGGEAPAPVKPQEVVHAEFQKDPSQSGGDVQQVRGERFGGLPHPGASPANPPVAPLAAQPPGSNARAFGGASLTDPIATEPHVQAAPFPGGNVNISRGVNPPRPSGFDDVPPQRAALAESPVVARFSAGAQQEEASSPKVTLRWGQQAEINVGQESRCHLIVRNSGSTIARDLEIVAQFPSTVKLTASQPAASPSGSRLSWQLPELRPGEERKFEVALVPTQRGEIAASADVRFSTSARGAFAVAEPMLAVDVNGPGQILVGEPASHTVTVTNPGTGVATGVQIEAVIPKGLEHARGDRLVMDLGSLNPGESRNVRLALTAVAAGQHKLEVQARAESGLIKNTVATVNVIAPKLASAIQGPALRYLGRQGTWAVKVGNESSAATDNVQVRYKVPAEFDYVSADLGAQYDPNTRLLTWFVGRLESRQSAELKVTLMARQLGQTTHAIRATSEQGALSDSEFRTVVEGTSSLSLQVTDLEDPVEVGSDVVYEVRVRNEGSAGAKNVGVACEMAPGTRLIGVDGPVEHRVDKNVVLFRPVAELPAGQTLTIKVKIAAAKPGSLRFRAQLTSESLTEPLLAEEQTKFYGE